MEDNTREGESSRIRKDMVGYLQAVLGDNKFLVQFKDDQKREMGSISISYLCSKEEVCLQMEDTILDLPQK